MSDIKTLDREISKKLLRDLDVDVNDADEEVSARWWRSHFCAFVHEIHHGRPNMLNIAPDVADSGPFNQVLQQIVSTNFKPVREFWDLNPANISFLDLDSAATLMNNPGARRFSRKLAEAVKRSSERLEKEWTPLRTHRACATLSVMDISRGDSGWVKPDGYGEFRARLLHTTTAVMEAARVGGENMGVALTSITVGGEPVDISSVDDVWYILMHSIKARQAETKITEMDPSDPMIAEQVESAKSWLRDNARWNWHADWLAKMRLPHAPNVPRRFNLVQHRLEALREVPIDEFITTGAPPWLSPLPEMQVDPFKAPLEANADGGGIAPWDWRAADEKCRRDQNGKQCWHCQKREGDDGPVMKYCSRCHVACYCDRECQTKHYKEHKLECDDYKHKFEKMRDM